MGVGYGGGFSFTWGFNDGVVLVGGGDIVVYSLVNFFGRNVGRDIS